MLRIHRTERREKVEATGRKFTLVSQSWTVRLALPAAGGAWSYHRPLRLEVGGATFAIRDHLMIARIGAVLILITTILTTRRQ